VKGWLILAGLLVLAGSYWAVYNLGVKEQKVRYFVQEEAIKDDVSKKARKIRTKLTTMDDAAFRERTNKWLRPE